MLYGQELLNKVNEMIKVYESRSAWEMVENYKAKRAILENEGYQPIGTINHIDKEETKQVVWITSKNVGNEANDFHSNINYWTGTQTEDKTVKLNESDFNITVLETIKTENLTIEYVLSNYKNQDAISYFKVITKDNKVFQVSDYGQYFNVKGIKGIKAIKNEFEENIDTLDIFQKYQEKLYEVSNYHQL